jgi:hypothetical protein
MRARALGDLFDNLAAGDTVTWAVVGVFLLGAAALGLFVLKVKRDLDREDKARGRKRH